jgi:Fe-S cluster biosynthesis and repair protein YggX
MTTPSDPRIEQFAKMAREDPDNELGHFSLGKACLEAGRFEEAAASLHRATTLNPRLSKAYQLLGEALEKSGRRTEAVEVLTQGVRTADEQGDRAPREAMAERLRGMGAAVPAFREAARPPQPAAPTSALATPGFRCSRCGRPSGQLPRPPFKGALGEKVLQRICATCWREWILMGTKVINELGLALSDPASQQVYDQYMVEFLQLEDR